MIANARETKRLTFIIFHKVIVKIYGFFAPLEIEIKLIFFPLVFHFR